MASERSVRNRLLGWLFVPLGVVLLAAGVVTYRSSLQVAADSYDRSLLDPALAIAARLRFEGTDVQLNLPKSVLDALHVDSSDRLFLAVIANGRVLAAQEDLPAPPRGVAA